MRTGRPRLFSVEPESIYIRFWSKVAVTANSNKCWNWSASKGKKGYGRFKVDKKSMESHRVAFFISQNKDPKELFVCHSCDNPSCCNPKHLFLGTNKDNIDDCIKKGRFIFRPKGESHPNSIKRGADNASAKLNAEQVAEIRRKYKDDNISSRKLGAYFGVNKSTILRIVKNKLWVQDEMTEMV